MDKANMAAVRTVCWVPHVLHKGRIDDPDILCGNIFENIQML
jgi:hypothetical protein